MRDIIAKRPSLRACSTIIIFVTKSSYNKGIIVIHHTKLPMHREHLQPSRWVRPHRAMMLAQRFSSNSSWYTSNSKCLNKKNTNLLLSGPVLAYPILVPHVDRMSRAVPLRFHTIPPRPLLLFPHQQCRACLEELTTPFMVEIST